jgi:hypothetical protein
VASQSGWLLVRGVKAAGETTQHTTTTFFPSSLDMSLNTNFLIVSCIIIRHDDFSNHSF